MPIKYQKMICAPTIVIIFPIGALISIDGRLRIIFFHNPKVISFACLSNRCIILDTRYNVYHDLFKKDDIVAHAFEDGRCEVWIPIHYNFKCPLAEYLLS